MIKTNLSFGFNDDYLSLFLNEDAVIRTNGGRVSDSTLKKYDHLVNGFWYCKNYDILENCESDWYQVKPFTPQVNWQKNKPIKYQSPPKRPTSLILPIVSEKRWKAIAKKYNVKINEKKDKNFWQWVVNHPELEVTITEGAKKVLSLLSQNVISIGVSGIWNFRIKDENDVKKLYPELIKFCHAKRNFNICFDQDEKPKTIKAVNKATFTLCSCLNKNQSKSYILQWDKELGKGIDDAIVNSEDKERFIKEIYDDRESFSFWSSKHHLKLSQVDFRFNSRWVSDGLKSLPNNRLIAIKSPQGTGKTEVIANYVRKQLNQGNPCFVLVHLESLAKALSRRFGVPYRTEKDPTKGYYGFSLCIDSCMRKNQGLDPSQWENYTVVIDEIEQVINHLLNGTTEVSKYRSTILITLKELLMNADKVVIADADLTDISVNFVEKLMEEKAYTLVNDYKYENYKFIRFEKEAALFERMEQSLSKNEKLFITTTSQKARGKFSTTTIEHFINENYPHLKVLRIDSKTIEQQGHPAFRCQEHINEVVTDYDVVIVSPSLQTGVSIDVRGYFDALIGFGSANVTPMAFLQQLWRLRDENVPRYFYTRTVGNNYIGNSSSSHYGLLSDTKEVAKTTLQLLNYADNQLQMDECDPVFVQTWAKISARQNACNRCYLEVLEHLIKEQGHNLQIITNEALSPIKEEIQKNRDKAKQNEYQKKLDSLKLNSEDVERLKKKKIKDGLTEDEQYALEKHLIEVKYKTNEDTNPLTTELIAFDDDGNYKSLRTWYYLTFGYSYLKSKDKSTIDKLAENNDNKILSFDINRSTYTTTVKALKKLEVEEFINQIEGKQLNGNDPLLIELENKITRFRKGLSKIGIKKLKYPVATINGVLRLIGLKLIKVEKGIYKLEKHPQFTDEILNQWLIYDRQKEEIDRELATQNHQEVAEKTAQKTAQNESEKRHKDNRQNEDTVNNLASPNFPIIYKGNKLLNLDECEVSFITENEPPPILPNGFLDDDISTSENLNTSTEKVECDRPPET